MSIPAFLEKVEVALVAQEELVGAVAQTDAIGEGFVAVAQCNAVEVASQEYCHRVGGTVAHAHVHHFLFVCVGQARCHIGSVCHTVGMS